MTEVRKPVFRGIYRNYETSHVHRINNDLPGGTFSEFWVAERCIVCRVLYLPGLPCDAGREENIVNLSGV